MCEGSAPSDLDDVSRSLDYPGQPDIRLNLRVDWTLHASIEAPPLGGPPHAFWFDLDRHISLRLLRTTCSHNDLSNCGVLTPRYVPTVLYVTVRAKAPRVDLKNTTDDALPNYLTSLKFQQSHFLTDIRLTLGYSAVIIAAATFIFDYKLGWDETKGITFYAVIAYFLLNGALTLWIWFAEKGKIFQGTSAKGTLVRRALQIGDGNESRW